MDFVGTMQDAKAANKKYQSNTTWLVLVVRARSVVSYHHGATESPIAIHMGCTT